jgi:hypothetical protein
MEAQAALESLEHQVLEPCSTFPRSLWIVLLQSLSSSQPPAKELSRDSTGYWPLE